MADLRHAFRVIRGDSPSALALAPVASAFRRKISIAPRASYLARARADAATTISHREKQRDTETIEKGPRSRVPRSRAARDTRGGGRFFSCRGCAMRAVVSSV
jgi:hypothetical protein